MQPVPLTTRHQPRRRDRVADSANSARWIRDSTLLPVITGWLEIPPTSGSCISLSQCSTAKGGSTVSPSMHTTRSAPRAYLFHPLFSTPAFLCGSRGISHTVTGYRAAISAVLSVQPFGMTTIWSMRRVWASSDSIAGPTSSPSLCAGTNATIRGRAGSGRSRGSGTVEGSVKRGIGIGCVSVQSGTVQAATCRVYSIVTPTR